MMLSISYGYDRPLSAFVARCLPTYLPTLDMTQSNMPYVEVS